jgi:uncharacterized protein YutE (UPF0331/DUF86 family)
VVDKAVLARKISAIQDAVARIREVLPTSAGAFHADRTVREVVTLNLFVALQEALAVAAHWIADEGWDVPQSYGDVFTVLADRGILDRDLASRLRGAAGLRNLIAHQYGVVDVDRIFAIASSDLDDLRLFCQQIAARSADS